MENQTCSRIDGLDFDFWKGIKANLPLAMFFCILVVSGWQGFCFSSPALLSSWWSQTDPGTVEHPSLQGGFHTHLQLGLLLKEVGFFPLYRPSPFPCTGTSSLAGNGTDQETKLSENL